MIEIVQRMFEVRANEWDELVKVGAMVPLHKKGPGTRLIISGGVFAEYV